MSDNVTRYFPWAYGDADGVSMKPDDLGDYVAYDDFSRLLAENAALKRAKAENDERFMIERDEARQERDALKAENAQLKTELDQRKRGPFGYGVEHLRQVLSKVDDGERMVDLLNGIIGQALDKRDEVASERDAFKAEVERLRKYTKHADLCAIKGGYNYGCTCGLEQP